MEAVIKTIIAGIVVGVTYLFGAPDVWLMGLIVFVVVDYISGIASAYFAGEWSSKTGLKGIIKKIMYFALVAVATITDTITDAEGILRAAVMGFLLANEALSILENCARMGLPVPDKLLKALNKMKSLHE